MSLIAITDLHLGGALLLAGGNSALAESVLQEEKVSAEGEGGIRANGLP
jgi:hypothetical protein